MSLIPDEELKSAKQVNLAPMVDFLFLIVAVFAVLAITHAALYDTEVNLVKLKTSEQDATLTPNPSVSLINISVAEDGQYCWISEAHQYIMDSVGSIKAELAKQQKLGILPEDKQRVKILLHVDKNAKWEPIAQVLVGIRQSGFTIHPVYEPVEN